MDEEQTGDRAGLEQGQEPPDQSPGVEVDQGFLLVRGSEWSTSPNARTVPRHGCTVGADLDSDRGADIVHTVLTISVM